jgi:hypothetical protein
MPIWDQRWKMKKSFDKIKESSFKGLSLKFEYPTFSITARRYTMLHVSTTLCFYLGFYDVQCQFVGWRFVYEVVCTMYVIFMFFRCFHSLTLLSYFNQIQSLGANWIYRTQCNCYLFKIKHQIIYNDVTICRQLVKISVKNFLPSIQELRITKISLDC